MFVFVPLCPTISQICTLLSGCLELGNTKCGQDCISGQEECPQLQCGVKGVCIGALEGIRKVISRQRYNFIKYTLIILMVIGQWNS